ncbi:hypothetical protein SARC_01432 [Sphaeroforma arctica JP610]|uniref:Uncharacterized protein n=1 Tax=Sphaeroforma arctica JP610 TaxID=667725 RepID=A0A0L0GC03_9EUKA|nr:hypothetical protein SARC_01432 [Sphaeroforma arctica JP610]KNC86426.1 hypothetical protein SARC_01432 [Sphaeroforma arctica JP610]|eukprot:XP_014160328.1 hypothetical protein SARC_01432 [Sphaeroforma arctica JP610]
MSGSPKPPNQTHSGEDHVGVEFAAGVAAGVDSPRQGRHARQNSCPSLYELTDDEMMNDPPVAPREARRPYKYV